MADMKEKAHAGTNTGADAARKGVDAAERGAHGLVEKAGDLAQQGKDAVANLADKGKQAASQLMDQAGDVGQKVQRWAGDAYGVTAERVKEYSDEATSMIRRYPIPAVLVALGVGLVIGKLLR